MFFRATAAAAFLTLSATTAFAGDPIGTWASAKNDEGKSLDMTITACGSQLCGTIAKVHGGDTSVEGKQMLKGMNKYGDNRWDDGEIWAADDKKWYDSKMEMTSDNDLTVSGCVAFGLICREVKWTRIQ
jgi:uncharacterized protein (DUF2147 family)